MTDFTGNDLGKPERETVRPNGRNETTVYSYDENGNKSSVTYPSGYRIDFKYDAVNRLTRVFRPLDGGGRSMEKLEYDLRGNKTAETEPSGAVHTMEYDGSSRLIRETFSPAPGEVKNGVRVREYRFNRVGSRTMDTGEDGKRTFMDFDGMQRAAKVTSPEGSSKTLRYGRNSGSDLFSSSSFKATSSEEDGGAVTGTDFDANYRRTAAITGKGSVSPRQWTFSYDAVGNLLVEIAPDNRRTTYEHDALNRLIKTTWPDGRTERILYSSTGLKYATIDKSGVRVEQTFDAAGEPIEKNK